MAQTGYTPIQLYNSSTPSAAPTAGNLAAGELAINTADGKLFYKDSGGVVQVIATTAGASGDVVGPASATDGNLAAFDGTTGKLIKQASTVTVAQGGTGITSGTSGGVPYFSGSSTIASSAALTANFLVIGGGAGVAPATTTTGTGVLTALGNNVNATGGFTTIDGTATLTNKRITARVSSAASIASPLAWNSNSFDQYAATAQAVALTINADAGAPTDGQKIIFRFKDNGVARALTWTTGTTNSFRAIGVTLPTTTVISKTVYVGCVYNAADSRWDAVAVAQEA